MNDEYGEDEYLRCFFFLFFLLRDRCRFFDFFDSFSVRTPFFISASIVPRFTATQGLFLLGCSFNGSPTLDETSLLLRPWSLFDLIREGLLSRSLELTSLPGRMLDLCIKTEQAYIY